tara:strand:- start:19182 stop:20414 length:1233 start_codon:yes stop_codon:yes gene_type:complete
MELRPTTNDYRLAIDAITNDYVFLETQNYAISDEILNSNKHLIIGFKKNEIKNLTLKTKNDNSLQEQQITYINRYFDGTLFDRKIFTDNNGSNIPYSNNQFILDINIKKINNVPSQNIVSTLEYETNGFNSNYKHKIIKKLTTKKALKEFDNDCIVFYKCVKLLKRNTYHYSNKKYYKTFMSSRAFNQFQDYLMTLFSPNCMIFDLLFDNKTDDLEFVSYNSITINNIDRIEKMFVNIANLALDLNDWFKNKNINFIKFCNCKFVRDIQTRFKFLDENKEDNCEEYNFILGQLILINKVINLNTKILNKCFDYVVFFNYKFLNIQVYIDAFKFQRFIPLLINFNPPKICCICLEDKESHQGFNCGNGVYHSICEGCNKLYKDNKCPMCRTKFIKVDEEDFDVAKHYIETH